MKKPQLFMLHFAGGNCYSFQFVAPLLNDFEVICPELPGRGRRMNEPLLKNFDEAVLDMYTQVRRQLNGSDFLLYGHSMGAYMAFKIANMLEKTGVQPSYLLVSGNPGPGARERKNRHLMKHDQFIDELKKMGGIQEELLTNMDLFSFFEPILRADLEIAEKNGLELHMPVDAPMYAMMGDAEDGSEKIPNWGRFTHSRFDYELLEGDHFFIYKHPQRLANIIRYCYGKSQQNASIKRKQYTQ